jgi:twinkle protein
VDINEWPWALYCCHHCEEKGSVNLEKFISEDEVVVDAPAADKVAAAPPVVVSKFDTLSDEQLAWLKLRGISEEAAERAGLVNSKVYVSARKEKVPCIGFPYTGSDGVGAVKWRDGAKHFTQTGAARSLWRIEDFKGGDLIITEGEMDALSFEEIGVFATSVPNGAPAAPVRDSGNSKKFSYLWDAKDEIARADRVIIAGDQDAPGEVLPEEIARRIGKAKCWRMVYPADCKDANDVLMTHGPEELARLLDEATPWPIGGLRDAKEYREDALSIWRDGMSRGIDIPVGDISDYYRPTTGTLTVCTGVPGSGKSTFLTWLSFLLAKQEGWTTACFSAETSSQVHILQLAALYTKKPFHGMGKMSEAELNHAIDWVGDRFVFLDESETTIDSIIERAQAAVLRNGVRALIIDPFNFISTDDPDGNDNGQRGYNKLLVRLKGFAVEHDVAVWLVAHPTKMYRDSRGNTPIPTGYDISGSAHFFNVADSGLTLSREKDTPNVSKLTCWKSRFSWLGKVGETNIGFNPVDGSFHTQKEWGMSDSDWDLGGDTND